MEFQKTNSTSINKKSAIFTFWCYKTTSDKVKINLKSDMTNNNNKKINFIYAFQNM